MTAKGATDDEIFGLGFVPLTRTRRLGMAAVEKADLLPLIRNAPPDALLSSEITEYRATSCSDPRTAVAG